MSKLISVVGPHYHAPNNPVNIQWSMGNTCNYSCEYCPSILHNGTSPWMPKETYLKTVEKVCDYYKEHTYIHNGEEKVRAMHWELIGGEVTTIPDFEEILQRLYDYKASVTVYSNGSRTVRWWEEARNFLQGVVLTYHPLTMDKQHFKDVVDVLKGHVTVDISIAGISGQVKELYEFGEELREMFNDNNGRQSIYDVSIAVKTMYKKLLGGYNNYDTQETWYDYTPEEIEIMQRPGVIPNPTPPEDNIPSHVKGDPKYWSTEFKYEDGTVKYVQSHQIINEGLNKFAGMKCHLGSEGLNIDMHGEIISSWCGAKSFGNITQIKELELPTEHYNCPFEYCNNLNDISITKSL